MILKGRLSLASGTSRALAWKLHTELGCVSSEPSSPASAVIAASIGGQEAELLPAMAVDAAALLWDRIELDCRDPRELRYVLRFAPTLEWLIRGALTLPVILDRPAESSWIHCAAMFALAQLFISAVLFAWLSWTRARIEALARA